MYKKLLLFSFFIVRIIICEPISAPLGPCECGVFGKPSVSSIIGTSVPMNEEPMLKQKPMNVTCNETGKEVCIKMCTALAQAAKSRGPTLLCAIIRHANDLKVTIFARHCDMINWFYTGLTSEEPICCHEGEPIPCDLETNQ